MNARRFVLAIAFALASSVAGAQPATDVIAAVQRFYGSIGAGDVDGAMALWSKDAPGRAAFRRRLAGILRVRCVEIHSIEVTRLEVDGTRATANVTVSLTKRHLHTTASDDRVERATLTWQQDAAGVWLITAWQRQEEALAAAIGAAKSEEERRAILAAQRQLVTLDLMDALDRRALELINNDRLAELETTVDAAATVASELGDPAAFAIARSLDSIRLRRRREADMPGSVRAARESVQLAELSGNSDVLARTLLRLGRTERWSDFRELGKAPYTRATDLFDDVEDASAVIMSMGGVAEYYGVIGDHRAALHYALRSRELAIATGDRVAELNADMHIGYEYRFDAVYGPAINYFEDVASIAAAEHITGSIPAEALYEAALCYAELGDEKGFLTALQRGRELRGDDNAESKAFALTLLSEYHQEKGDLVTAAREAEEALGLSVGGSREAVVRPRPLVSLSITRLRQRRYAEALALADQIRESFDRAYLMGRAYRGLGRRKEAYASLREAIAGADVALDSRMDHQKETHYRRYVDSFVQVAGMLAEDGRTAEALEMAERGKGRTLLNILRVPRGVALEAITEDERKQERELQERLAAANSQRGPTAQAGLERARSDLQAFRTFLSLKYPRLSAVQPNVPVITREQLAELLPDRSAALLEFVVGEEQTKVLLVRRSGAGVTVLCRTIAVPRARLGKSVDQYVSAIAARDRLYAAQSRELYRVVVAPFEPELRGVRTLGIIPDGPLWQLPFESLLRPDGHFLVEQVAVFYAPSITIYREMTRRERAAHPPGAFLAFADPPVARRDEGPAAMKLRDDEYAPLPDAAREVRDIAALYDPGRSRIYVGAEALESRAKAESSRYDVIHFATHGVLDDRDPMFSHLVLARRPGDPSEDGLLETWEMMDLKLHADLAVLSACESARGPIHDGEGLIGMSWALFVAGTSSTIATQWKIASSTAADLMVDFYRQWRGAASGMPFAKAEALRRARVHVLSDPAHRHPFYWSAYVLIGAGS